jgi:poly(hydroxyalkanoate) depolymerase family esterase
MMRASGLWPRLREFFAGLFRKKAPAPGSFVADAKLSWRGFLLHAPLVAPQREYLAYVPARAALPWSFRRHPLLVLLHGCRQTPEDIAAATRVAALADGEDLLVLLPRQNPRANAWGCWNWFDAATAHGWGEAAIVAAQIRAVRRGYRIDRKRVFVAGLSSGGALAAALGLRRPDLIAGVFVHSGVACGAASSPYAALGVLRNGADVDVARIGRDARAAADPLTLPVPLLVVQGGADDVVAPVNAAQLVRQYLALNGHPAAAGGPATTLPPPDHVDRETTPAQGRVIATSEWWIAGRLAARHVLVDALGHAWSGGDERYAYNDAGEPDATALLRAFIRDTVQ